MWSKYQDVSGTWRRVHGDITKIPGVPGLSSAAHRLLQNIEHTCRRFTGTMQARRMMRFHTQAHRIRYGTPIVVTFSPDESHN